MSAGLLQASDEEHLSFAVKAGRVIFTQDEDFLIAACVWRPARRHRVLSPRGSHIR
jgi:predicted nuclease of predicted toxin-antitoxin system